MNIDEELTRRIRKMREKMIKDGTLVQTPLLSENVDFEQAIKNLRNCINKKESKKKKAVII